MAQKTSCHNGDKHNSSDNPPCVSFCGTLSHLKDTACTSFDYKTCMPNGRLSDNYCDAKDLLYRVNNTDRNTRVLYNIT